MWSYRVRAIILTGVACFFVVGISPARSQEQTETEQTEKTEEVQPAPTGDPQAATTTETVDIAVDELQLIVKPLTLAELENEAAGWMLLLKTKATEISQAEVAIKRQNLAIAKQEEGANALGEAQKALEEAEKLQSEATRGSPEYEAAVKKVEEAQANFKKAQEAVQEARDTKKELTEDEALKEALEKAKDTGDLDQAQKAIEDLNKERDKMTAGSLNYDEATEKIEKIEAAIKAVEGAKEDQTGAQPDSPEHQEATQKLEKAQNELKQLLEKLGIGSTKQSTEQSSRKLERATAALEDTEVNSSETKKVAGLPDVVDSEKQLEQQQKQLEKTTEQLEDSAEAESEAKNQLVVTVTELQAEQTAIIDRFNVILDELEKKGGNAESYRQYIQAVSSIELDVKDAEGLGLRLLSWAQSDEGGMRWVSNTGKFLGVFIASVLFAQILGIFLNRSLSQFSSISVLMRRFIVLIIKRGGILVGFLLALTALGVSLGPVLALLGGVSFVLAFALQSNLGNLASGLMIMAYKPFDVGDEVKVGSLWGTVDSITLANTKIEGFDGQLFSVPNNIVWGDTIENLSNSEIRQFKTWLRIGFDENLASIEQLLLDIVRSHPKVLENPAPGTFVWRIEDYYISLSVSGWAKKDDYWSVYQDIIRRVQERFANEGLQLAAIPKEIGISVEANENGKLPQLASETPIYKRLAKEPATPNDPAERIDAQQVEV